MKLNECVVNDCYKSDYSVIAILLKSIEKMCNFNTPINYQNNFLLFTAILKQTFFACFNT